MVLAQSNDIVEFDLLSHPEYLEDEFHFNDDFRMQADHQAYDAYEHITDHHGDSHRAHPYYGELAGHVSTYLTKPSHYEGANHKYIDSKSAHEEHGHQDEYDHHEE